MKKIKKAKKRNKVKMAVIPKPYEPPKTRIIDEVLGWLIVAIIIAIIILLTHWALVHGKKEVKEISEGLKQEQMFATDRLSKIIVTPLKPKVEVTHESNIVVNPPNLINEELKFKNGIDDNDSFYGVGGAIVDFGN